MCGIFCVFSNTDFAFDVARKGVNHLAHRGPDEANLLCFQAGELYGAIGHTRLSIVGLGEPGRQPKSNENSILVFNGEIYGTAAGRTLKQSGLHSDTGWLWNQYEGAEELQVGGGMDGIWGIATFNKAKQELVITRDAVGVIPIYVYRNESLLIVSSEIQAIAKSLGSLPIDLEALTESLATRQLSYGRYVKGLECIRPGQTQRYRFVNGGMKQVASSVEVGFLQSHHHLFDDLQGAFSNAITKQVEADVPVGLQLSGGVDSTYIAATLSNLGYKNLTPITATTKWDQSECMQAIENAKRLGLPTPVCINVTQNSFSEGILRTLQEFDPAFSHPNFFAIQQIANKARQEGIKVLLCGEGSDELFRGYTRLLLSNIIYPLSRKASNCLLQWTERYRLNFDWCSKAPTHALLKRSASENYEWVREAETRHLFANYLHELLYRQNIACMSQSVEARVPFLDFSVLSYAIEHPLSFLARREGKRFWLKGQVRSSLMDAYSGYEGPKRKSGFALPVHMLFNNEMNRKLEQAVAFSKAEMGIDRSFWLKKHQQKQITSFEFERTLWPAILTLGALQATGNILH